MSPPKVDAQSVRRPHVRAACPPVLHVRVAQCPRWLQFVEGVSHTTASGAPSVVAQSDYGHNWASNLEGIRHRPLSMRRPSKLVLSPHVYGPSVAPQPYFDDASFPANMPPIWDAHFGFVAARGLGCVVVGEWGGWYTGNDAVWQRAFAAYLGERGIGAFYWALNPTSRDTGGLVLANWVTPNPNKVALLRSMAATPIDAADGAATAAAGPHGGPHKLETRAGGHDGRTGEPSTKHDGVGGKHHLHATAATGGGGSSLRALTALTASAVGVRVVMGVNGTRAESSPHAVPRERRERMLRGAVDERTPLSG